MADKQVFTDLEGRLRADWGHLGESLSTSGTIRIAHVPHVAPKAWLHRLYPGCPVAEIDDAERRMRRPVPLAWRHTLEDHNGLHLFVAGLFLYGVLAGGLVTRSSEDPQPFSLEGPNCESRPRGGVLAPDDFVIGGASVGTARRYLLCEDNSFAIVTKDGSRLLSRWESLGELLMSEYEATRRMYDREGRYLG